MAQNCTHTGTIPSRQSCPLQMMHDPGNSFRTQSNIHSPRSCPLPESNRMIKGCFKIPKEHVCAVTCAYSFSFPFMRFTPSHFPRHPPWVHSSTIWGNTICILHQVRPYSSFRYLPVKHQVHVFPKNAQNTTQTALSSSKFPLES